MLLPVQYVSTFLSAEDGEKKALSCVMVNAAQLERGFDAVINPWVRVILSSDRPVNRDMNTSLSGLAAHIPKVCIKGRGGD